MQKGKFWQKRKFDAGWACIRWPEEFGGRGANAIQQVILGQEEAKVAAPETGVFGIGQGMAAPTLMTWADQEAQAAKYESSATRSFRAQPLQMVSIGIASFRLLPADSD